MYTCTIDISDELYKQDYTKVILPRQEVALVHEADAYARSTGKVGVGGDDSSYFGGKVAQNDFAFIVPTGIEAEGAEVNPDRKSVV